MENLQFMQLSWIALNSLNPGNNKLFEDIVKMHLKSLESSCSPLPFYQYFYLKAQVQVVSKDI